MNQFSRSLEQDALEVVKCLISRLYQALLAGLQSSNPNRPNSWLFIWAMLRAEHCLPNLGVDGSRQHLGNLRGRVLDYLSRPTKGRMNPVDPSILLAIIVIDKYLTSSNCQDQIINFLYNQANNIKSKPIYSQIELNELFLLCLLFNQFKGRLDERGNGIDRKILEGVLPYVSRVSSQEDSDERPYFPGFVLPHKPLFGTQWSSLLQETIPEGDRSWVLSKAHSEIVEKCHASIHDFCKAEFNNLSQCWERGYSLTNPRLKWQLNSLLTSEFLVLLAEPVDPKPSDLQFLVNAIASLPDEAGYASDFGPLSGTSGLASWYSILHRIVKENRFKIKMIHNIYRTESKLRGLSTQQLLGPPFSLSLLAETILALSIVIIPEDFLMLKVGIGGHHHEGN